MSPYIIFNQSKELFRNVLEVQGLSKGFDGEQVLKDINLMIETGERVAIIGQNGIGKSTLLKTLFGEIEPDSGNKNGVKILTLAIMLKIIMKSLKKI